MTHSYPYFEPEFVPLSEFIPPLEVCMDNDTSDDFTIIQVDGANKPGILLKIVQILSDLGLIILKSYVSSDGDWFMNAFHVTDQQGHKLEDPALICFIKQFLNNAQRQNRFFSPAQVKIRHDNIINVNHLASTVLELYFLNRTDIFSEVITVLSNLSYTIDSGELWTHNGRVACIIYPNEQNTGMPITDRDRYDNLGENLASLMKVHHLPNELWEVRLRNPTSCQIHTERRLHQMLQEYKDFEIGPPPLSIDGDQLSLFKLMDTERGFGNANKSNEQLCRPQVSIENWNDRDYLVINVKSEDRPKLMFDTICVLTDMSYDVLHGFVSCHESLTFQEYFVRGMNGHIMLNEIEKQNVIRSLAAAVERRMSKGLKMEVHTFDRHGLLLVVSRKLRENNISFKTAEFAKDGCLAVGTFYITDNDADNIDQQMVKMLQNEFEKDIFFEKKNDHNINSTIRGRWNLLSAFCSLGRSLWSHMKRIFSNFNFFK